MEVWEIETVVENENAESRNSSYNLKCVKLKQQLKVEMRKVKNGSVGN